MAITVAHGPSMIPVGRLAFATGRAEYANRRRREIEAQQMQHAEMQQRQMLENQRIAANFQQAQFQQQAGMQRIFAQNQFQADRDQKIQAWQMDQRAIDHQRRLDLANMGHSNQLDQIQMRYEMEDEQTATALRRTQAAQANNRLYGMLTPYGKEMHDKIGGQISELDKAMQAGEINQQQYDQSVGQLKQQQADILHSEMDSEYKRGARYQDGYVGVEGMYVVERINGEDRKTWNPEGEDGVRYKNVIEWQDANKITRQEGDHIYEIIPDPYGGAPEKVTTQDPKVVARVRKEAEDIRIAHEEQQRTDANKAATETLTLFERYTSVPSGDGDFDLEGGRGVYRGAIPRWALGQDGEVSYDAILNHQRRNYGLPPVEGTEPTAADLLNGNVPAPPIGNVPAPTDRVLDDFSGGMEPGISAPSNPPANIPQNPVPTIDEQSGRDPQMFNAGGPQVGSAARPFPEGGQGEAGDFQVRSDGEVDQILGQPRIGGPLSVRGLDNKNPQVAKDISKQMGEFIPPEMIQRMSAERLALVVEAYNNAHKEASKESDETMALQGIMSATGQAIFQ